MQVLTSALETKEIRGNPLEGLVFGGRCWATYANEVKIGEGVGIERGTGRGQSS